MTKNKRASIVWYKTISFCHALVSGSTRGTVSVANPQLSIILKAVSNRIHPEQQVAHMLQPLLWPSPPIGRGSLTSSWVTGLAGHKRCSWQMWFGMASEVINGCSDYRPYHTTTHPLGIKLKQQGLCQMPFSLFPMHNLHCDVLLEVCMPEVAALVDEIRQTFSDGLCGLFSYLRAKSLRLSSDFLCLKITFSLVAVTISPKAKSRNGIVTHPSDSSLSNAKTVKWIHGIFELNKATGILSLPFCSC